MPGLDEEERPELAEAAVPGLAEAEGPAAAEAAVPGLVEAELPAAAEAEVPGLDEEERPELAHTHFFILNDFFSVTSLASVITYSSVSYTTFIIVLLLHSSIQKYFMKNGCQLLEMMK